MDSRGHVKSRLIIRVEAGDGNRWLPSLVQKGDERRNAQWARCADFRHSRDGNGMRDRTLPPVVEYEEAGPAVAGFVRPVHRDTLDLSAEAAPQHVPIGLFARQIDPGQHIRLAGRYGERTAGVEQPRKPLLAAGARPAPHRI